MVAHSHRHALLTTCSSQARWQAQGQRAASTGRSTGARDTMLENRHLACR